MFQKSRLRDPFFGFQGQEPQRASVATEIVDTDWDEEDIVSEIEEDDPNSPRVSLNSSGQQSATTLSSYEEAHTPRSSRTREAYPFHFDPSKPVEGPRGPHLFRSSTASSSSFEYQETLTLSPITPRTARPYEADLRLPILQDPLPRSRTSPYQFTHERLEPVELAMWSPAKVAQWMLNAGIEFPVAEKFVENDINGAILITLKFEDLRELHIKSFGVRTKVWEEIHTLRDRKDKEMSPRPDTPIEDEESKEVRRERRALEKSEDGDVERCRSVKRSRSKGGKRSQSKRKPAHEDIISPLESVSIVGIEQMMPKPHHCKKGENCSKYRRQQRMIEAFKKDHPFVDTDNGGIIMVAGDPGNPETAPAINRPSSTEVLRPFSDAVPSVVASSDVLGPGMPPFQYLQEAALRNLQTQDPQDNVRQFLDFQHQEGGTKSNEVPPTPPFEVYPGNRSPHEGLRALPKLSIPSQQQQQQQQQQHPRRQSQQSQHQAAPFVPYRMDKAEALSPDLQTPIAPYRFGTPFSDMDVPLTAVPLGPVARDASQSVPPDMNYRAAPVARSRASHRPSIQIMAPVEEDATAGGAGAATPVARSYHGGKRPSLSLKPTSPQRAPTSPPPPPRMPATSSGSGISRPNLAARTYPWTTPAPVAAATVKDAEGVTYQGPVKKRKTKMLRHEWHDQYAVLKGTRLALHANAKATQRTLEYVDIDDYAIACSSLSSTSRLNAAFKAMSITRSGGHGHGHGHKSSSSDSKDDIAAFSFQLIPQDPAHSLGVGRRLRKRESTSPHGAAAAAPLAAGLEGAANGTGKTHHFAVRSRDERIDWMRELMLAKALKQKGEGFEVSVNGNMI
ncbi:hypothetical protein F4780DRAFT_769881 [Xylariomycetidae sp. FL0641]|nr:hypothetical protein F4780DRAFT_769881 [Xylariomycetidae sp. FL0641]